MQIIFSRHGNTFAPGETPIWVGAKQDLPLVDAGIQQAKNLAAVLRETGLNLKAVYCGSLKRAHDYAKITLSELHSQLKPIVDSSLNEIDYGNWSGLSSEEIQNQGENAALIAWENFSKWPKAAGWSASPLLIANEVKLFAEGLIKKYAPTDTILVVTSSGRLRYFLQLIPNAFEQHIHDKNFKVATGNICLFTFDNSKRWQVKFWNKKPSQLLA